MTLPWAQPKLHRPCTSQKIKLGFSSQTCPSTNWMLVQYSYLLSHCSCHCAYSHKETNWQTNKVREKNQENNSLREEIWTERSTGQRALSHNLIKAFGDAVFHTLCQHLLNHHLTTALAQLYCNADCLAIKRTTLTGKQHQSACMALAHTVDAMIHLSSVASEWSPKTFHTFTLLHFKVAVGHLRRATALCKREGFNCNGCLWFSFQLYFLSRPTSSELCSQSSLSPWCAADAAY